jgi:hypothetical protein
MFVILEDDISFEIGIPCHSIHLRRIQFRLIKEVLLRNLVNEYTMIMDINRPITRKVEWCLLRTIISAIRVLALISLLMKWEGPYAIVKVFPTDLLVVKVNKNMVTRHVKEVKF